MPVQQTSIAALQEVKESKKVQWYKRILSLLAMRPQGLTNLEISSWTGIPINIVCPRMHELRTELYYVVFKKKRLCSLSTSKNSVSSWGLKMYEN